MINHLTTAKLTRIALAATVFIASSNAAYAFNSVDADPFLGQTVNLEAAAGSLVALPGVGPGGATLYANDFQIGIFGLPVTTSDGSGGIINTYSATFNAEFYNADGTPAIIPQGYGFANAGQQGDAYLPGGTFQVDFANRTSANQTGTFNMTLLQASFSGLSNLGTGLTVDLANLPTAQVSITQVGSGFGTTYNVDYLSNFVVQGQYYNNANGTGAPVQVPTLGDASQGGAPAGTTVPEPATFALLATGLAAMFGSRRRRTAVAA